MDQDGATGTQKRSGQCDRGERHGKNLNHDGGAEKHREEIGYRIREGHRADGIAWGCGKDRKNHVNYMITCLACAFNGKNAGAVA